MSLERAEERSRLAERQVAILAKSSGERFFEWFMAVFATFCIGFLLVKILLVSLGVSHTLASPLGVVSCMIVLILGGAFVLIRTIARKIADHELKQAKIYLSQFRYMSPLSQVASGSNGGGGFSNYKKNTAVMTGKQFAAEVKAAQEASATTSHKTEVQKSTTMMRTGRR